MRIQKLVKYLNRENDRLEVFTSTQGFEATLRPKMYSFHEDRGLIIHRLYDFDVRKLKSAALRLKNYLSSEESADPVGNSYQIQKEQTVSPEKYSVRLGDNLLPDPLFLWGIVVFFVAFVRLFWKRPRLIFATAPSYSNLVVGAIISVVVGRPLVIDLRDPWSTNPFQHGRVRLLRTFDRLLERLVFKRASRIVVVDDTFIEPMQRVHGLGLRDKISIIPNGFDPEDFDVTRKSLSLDSLSFVHAGRFYPGRDPLSSLSLIKTALGALKDDFRPTVYLVGSGEEYQAQIEDCGFGDIVKFTGFLRHAETVQYLMAADFLVLIPGIGKSTVTGKIFEYFAAGRPVILVGRSDSAAASLLKKHKAGVVIDPQDADAAQQLAEFVTSTMKFGWSGPCGVSVYSRKEIALEFSRLFNQVTNASR